MITVIIKLLCVKKAAKRHYQKYGHNANYRKKKIKVADGEGGRCAKPKHVLADQCAGSKDPFWGSPGSCVLAKTYSQSIKIIIPKKHGTTIKLGYAVILDWHSKLTQTIQMGIQHITNFMSIQFGMHTFITHQILKMLETLAHKFHFLSIDLTYDLMYFSF